MTLVRRGCAAFAAATFLLVLACDGGAADSPPDALALPDVAADARPDTASAPDVPAVPDVPSDAPAAPDAVPAGPPDAGPDGPPDSAPDVPPPPPPPPFLEKGLIVPEDSIPCTDLATGETRSQCNHHGSMVSVRRDGTVFAVWYHGIAEKSKDSAVLWSRRAPGGAWTAPAVLFDEPGRAEGNPVLWIDDEEEDALVLFFVTILGESWNDAEVRLIRSGDGGASWGDVVVLREEWGWMTRNHPLRLSTGELLLPCYDERIFVPTYLVSSDGFRAHWEELTLTPDVLIQSFNRLQPSVIERRDGTLFTLLRNAVPNPPTRAWQMTSPDFGRTWSAPERSAIPNDGVSMEQTKLRDGRVVAVFNNTTQGRFPLSAALSDDEGRTWSAVADLNAECPSGGCSYGYASVAEDPTDGSLWVTYTHDRRTIGWVHVSPAWIEQKGDAFATDAAE